MMKKPLIKVCGMREAGNIGELSALGVDMIGMIFCKESPRYVSMIPSFTGTLPDYSEERLRHPAKAAAGQEGRRPARVGVFCDEMPQTIITCIYNFGLDYVQLHGEESRVMIENLRRTVVPDIAAQLGVIKTISISETSDLARCDEYEGAVDYFLFDTACAQKGGSGKQFDWSVLESYHGTTPFLLSGGIGPEDAERVKQIRHPRFAGIDINSRFETAPGVKDVERVRQFVTSLR